MQTHHRQYCVNAAAQETAPVRIYSWSSLQGQAERPGNVGGNGRERNEGRVRYSMVTEQIPERHWGECAGKLCLVAFCPSA